MKIVVATDAWHPQVNGVVRSLAMTVDCLRRDGHEVEVIEPGQFRTVPCPSYSEIRLAIGCGRAIARLLDEVKPDRIHISTEGPIGWAVRRWCLKRGRHFTTAFHTRFPDYVAIRTKIPAEWTWKLMRRFHGAAERTFTATATLAEDLHSHGLPRTHHWPRGVDLDQFNPNVAPHPAMADLPRPILLNVGRVAVEKNIEAFLNLDSPGSKVVVGGGPALNKLSARYPDVLFLGSKDGAELAATYAAAVCFSFSPPPVLRFFSSGSGCFAPPSSFARVRAPSRRPPGGGHALGWQGAAARPGRLTGAPPQGPCAGAPPGPPRPHERFAGKREPLFSPLRLGPFFLFPCPGRAARGGVRRGPASAYRHASR